MFRRAVRDQRRGRRDLAFIALERRSEVQPELPSAGLDQEDAFGEGFGQGRPGGVHNAARVLLPRQPGHPGVEVLRDARRQASAGHDIPARGNRIRHERQAQTPLGLTQFGALQDEAELLARRRFIDREVLAGASLDRHGQGGDTFGFDEPAVRLSGGSSGGVEGQGPAAEALDHPGHVHAAAARVEAAGAATQLVAADDLLRGGADIQGGVYGEREDGLHRRQAGGVHGPSIGA